jgi:hypothetical protein
MSVSRKEACHLSGRGLTWLKEHECAWCDQGALYALMYGCGSIYGPRCVPAERFKKRASAAVASLEEARKRK